SPTALSTLSLHDALPILAQQRGGAHDLAGLAVAALGHVVLDPRLLHGGQRTALRQALDRGDLLAGDRGGRGDAGADRRTVQVHRAGATLRHAATELGSHELEL